MTKGEAMAPQGKLVDDCLNWEEMEGETPLVKKLNAYLTWSLIFREEVPADECVSYARKIANSKKLMKYTEIFDMIATAFGGPKLDKKHEEIFRLIAEGASAIAAVERKGK